MRAAPWLCALAAGALLLPATALGHTRGTSYSFWNFAVEVPEVRVRVSQLDLTRLQLDPALTEHYPEAVLQVLTEGLQLRTASGACTAADARLLAAAEGWLTVRWVWRCPAPQHPSAPGFEIRSRLLHAVAPSHLHFVRVDQPGGVVQERVLTSAAPVLTLAGAEAPPTHNDSFTGFVALGIEHILSGWDHLAFILALILLAAGLPEIALVATGFTLAHSLTLAGAVLGWVSTNAVVVEALIGFSIALVALENLWQRGGRERWVAWLLLGLLACMLAAQDSQLSPQVIAGLMLFCLCYLSLLSVSPRPARLRFALAFVFGLVHGFGFAGVLGEMTLPAERVFSSLLGFNLGVELGQLLVIGAVWPLLAALRRWPVALAAVQAGGSAVILGLGTYWFVFRSFA